MEFSSGDVEGMVVEGARQVGETGEVVDNTGKTGEVVWRVTQLR